MHWYSPGPAHPCLQALKNPVLPSGFERGLPALTWSVRYPDHIRTPHFRRMEARTHTHLLDGKEEFELRRELLLGVQTVGEVDPANAAVGVDLHPQGLDVICPVCATGEVAEVELDVGRQVVG